MWDVLVRTPRGSYNPRKFSMLLATFFVACFAYIFAAAPTAAAADAAWEGERIIYDGNTYEKMADDQMLPEDARGSSAVYRYLDETEDPALAHFIYFADDATDERSEKEATYVRYTLNPPNTYRNEQDKRILTITPAATTEVSGEEQTATSCAVDNVGWLVCGVAGLIADGIDQVYRLVSAFLTVQPLLGPGDNGLYNLWDVMRNFANVLFVIGFLVVIYSYLAGGGYNGYEIRKILPRVVIAAILINVSYWICSIAIDASNIIGVSLQDLLVNIRETAVATNENRNVGWGEITTYILSGGTIGALGFFAAAGGSITSLAFLLLVFLLTVVFSLFVAFIILAARQAIIIMLVVLAPIAFAAFILPNTEKWFDRWRSVFTTMLMLFPIFSLLFGGSQLAGAAIIQNAPDNEAGLAIMLFGMGVQIIPLVITPLLIQFSGGLLSRVAGIVNNAEKGLLDRSKGWATNRADFYKDRALANDNKWYNFARRGGQRMYQKDVARQKRQETYKKMAENRAHEREFRSGRFTNSRLGQAVGMENASYGYWDQKYRAADVAHQRIESHHKAEFDKKFDSSSDSFDARLYRERGDAYKYAQASKLADARFETDISELEAGKSDAVLMKIQDENTREAIRASLGQFSTKLQDMNREIIVEGDRKGLAEKQIQGQIAGALKANEIKINGQNIREYAAGIDENGATKVYARATAEMTKLHMENIDAVSSIYSNEGYELPELFTVVEGGRMRDGSKASDIQVHSAIKEIFTKKGNNWAAQKLLDYTATMGMQYDATDNVFRDIDGNALSESEANDRRDFQQIVKEYASQSPLKVDYMSATERTKLETGTYMAKDRGTMKSESMIIADAKVGKFDQTRLLNADVDVLQRMVQVFREPQNLAAIGDTGRKNLLDLIERVQANPQINASIKDRERGVMNALASYLDDSDNRAAGDKEREYYYVLDENNNKVRAKATDPGAQKETITVQAPTQYSYDKPFDGDIYGYGPRP